MSIRVSALVLMASLALAMGCPGGDGNGDGEAGTGNAGASGAGGSGTGGHSGASGTGSGGTGGGNSNMSPEDVAAGSCDSMGTDGTECTGIEEYQACLNDTCGYAECYSGPCAAYIDCLSTADDPCTATQDGTCSPSSECTSCFTSDANCAISCASNLDCGGGAGTGGAGGAAGAGGLPEGTCADLDACCASLSGDDSTDCMTAADSARMAGDFACAVYIQAFCP